MQKIIRNGGLALLLGSALASPSASAVAILTATSGGTVSVSDNGVGDVDPTVGAVTTVATIGGWLANINGGSTKPASGSALAPEMYLFGTNVRLGAGTLVINFTEAGFGPTPPAPGLQFSDIISGSVGGAGNISFAQYYQIGTSPRQLLKDFGSFTGSSFSASALSGFVPPSTASYSLIQEVIMQSTAGPTGSAIFNFNFSKQAVIPEIDAAAAAGSVSLVLGVLALLRERRRFATAK